jgi:hypothetical protein
MAQAEPHHGDHCAQRSHGVVVGQGGIHRHAASRTTAGTLTAIRDQAIELYEDGDICHGGLTDFLEATGLDPHHD